MGRLGGSHTHGGSSRLLNSGRSVHKLAKGDVVCIQGCLQLVQGFLHFTLIASGPRGSVVDLHHLIVAI